MLSRRIIQDAADMESCCVEIVFLTTYDICLDFFSHLAKIIKSPSSLIDGEAIDIQGIYPCNVVAFILYPISPWIVAS
jgi:hypothetical protein